MTNPSFWEKGTLSRPCDLIVVGAGIVGLSSALFYKQQYPQKKVVVLEKGGIPEGASTRNAGFACFGSVTEFMAGLESDSEENVKKLIRRRYLGLQLLRKTLGDDAIGYRWCGGYELFTDSINFVKTVEQLSRFNSWFLEVTGQKNAFETATLNGRDVIAHRLEGGLHPGKMMQTLINKVQAAGVDIKWNCKVTETDNSGMIYLENDAVIRAGQILIACNGFSGDIAEVDIKPARGLVMVSEPWPDNPWKGIFHYDRGFIYFRNVGDRLLLGGARNMAINDEETNRFGINKTIKQYLLEFAATELEFPEGRSFEHEWSGIMGFTPTKSPLVKRLGAHQSIAAGLSGMGIAIGMDVAKEAVRIVSR